MGKKNKRKLLTLFSIKDKIKDHLYIFVESYV